MVQKDLGVFMDLYLNFYSFRARVRCILVLKLIPI